MTRGRLLGLAAILGRQLQRDGVDAVALAGRLRSVGKDVAEVGATAAAVHLGAGHEQAAVGLGRHRPRVYRLPEAGPAGAAVELRLRREQLLSAAGAQVHPPGLGVPVGAGEGPLGAMLPADAKLLVAEFLAPLRVRLHQAILGRVHRRSFLSFGREEASRDASKVSPRPSARR